MVGCPKKVFTIITKDLKSSIVLQKSGGGMPPGPPFVRGPANCIIYFLLKQCTQWKQNNGQPPKVVPTSDGNSGFHLGGGGGGGLRPTISRRGNILDHAKLLGNFFTANFDENRWFWGGTLTESLLTTPNP